MKAYPT